MKLIFTYLGLLIGVSLFAQNTATLKGNVRDLENNILIGAEVILLDTSLASYTDVNGDYEMEVPAGKVLRLAVSFYEKSFTRTIAPLDPGEIYVLDVQLNTVFELREIDISGQRLRREVPSIIEIEPRTIEGFPVASGFENTLKSIGLGINTGGGELSSGYNVRGGNFDENLVYVNGIEVYRPFLARSGQQEGLSVVNLALVEKIQFSSGGFEAQYGDKMSSVLDITYRQPDSFRTTAQVSLLGAQVHFEDVSENNRFSYLVGARYRSNAYLLGSLDVQGDYKPRFIDVQTLLRYRLSSVTSLEWFSSVAQNRYLVRPQSQTTNFGNVNNAFSLFIAFGGQELMQYSTFINGLKLNHSPDKNQRYDLIFSAYNANEREHFTVEGAYRLDELETNLGSPDFANVRSNLGFGYFIDNARNDLVAQVYSGVAKGYNKTDAGVFRYGIEYKFESINDRLKEWRYNDSSGYNINTLHASSSKDEIILDEYLKADIDISSYRMSSYFQHSIDLNEDNGLKMTYGLRANYWSFNTQTVVSPRMHIAFQPNKKFNDSLLKSVDSLHKYYAAARPDWLFKAAVGYYYQPPFYRELRDLNGVINPELRAQRSIHFVLGADRNFQAWGRPFKFITEVYYKKLDHMIPYVIDNVRIRYLAENSSTGFAAGWDARVNGEFIEGVESWFNFSYLNTQERIVYTNDLGEEVQSDWLRRPTDQRVNFSILFQDELPSNPDYKMNLNLVFGSRMPYFFDGSRRYKEGFSIPPYRRVDIGFSKLVFDKDHGKKLPWLAGSESLWISLEVFNLLQVNNTISYSLVKDFGNNIYGVPNFLTGRRLNLRFVLKV